MHHNHSGTTAKEPLRARTGEELSRRRFISAAAAAGAGALPGVGCASALAAGAPGSRDLESEGRRPRVAVVFTACFYRSHAHVILENFLEPYLFRGERTEPGVQVVAFYADQLPENDMARRIARNYNIPIFESIEGALCLGAGQLAVDGVLSIGEHGDYPTNELGQKQYPRKRFFDEIAAVMERSGRSVPLFNDKHLSHRWDRAKQMYETARRLKIPFLAGSSVPLAERRPPLHLPRGAALEEAVSIHGGPAESYGFHALEVLQSLAEFRRGGESGVTRVRFLPGEDLWRAADEGRWSPELAEAAMAREMKKVPDLRQPVEGAAPHAILLEYADGFRATVLKIGRDGVRWNFACRMAGARNIQATRFNVGPWRNRNLFKALSHAIQHLIIHRDPPYPVERTLLTTGALEAAMRSRHQDGQPIETPHLRIAYEPTDFTAFRETGASWDIITEDTPQPRGVEPVGVEG